MLKEQKIIWLASRDLEKQVCYQRWRNCIFHWTSIYLPDKEVVFAIAKAMLLKENWQKGKLKKIFKI